MSEKLMPICLAIVGILFLAGPLCAQEQDVILLKDSELLRGKIVEDGADDEVLMMLEDSTFMRIPTDDIYYRSTMPVGTSDRDIKWDAFQPRDGSYFQFIIEPGVGIAKVDDATATFLKVSLIPSISFMDFFSVGVGTGLRVPFGSDGLIIPLHTDLRVTGRARVAPTLAAGFGTSFVAENGLLENGFLGYGMVGVNVKNFNGDSFSLLFGIDYCPQWIDGSIELPGFNVPVSGEIQEDVVAFTVALAINL